MIRVVVVLLMLSLITACSGVSRSLRIEQQLQRFEAAAGEPVKSFHYFGFNSWTPLGKQDLAVWTRPNQAWLLHTNSICPDLDFAQAIGLTSSLSRVQVRFDNILVGQVRCRIDSIRPVDVKALRELQREARRNAIEMRDSGTPASDAAEPAEASDDR